RRGLLSLIRQTSRLAQALDRGLGILQQRLHAGRGRVELKRRFKALNRTREIPAGSRRLTFLDQIVHLGPYSLAAQRALYFLPELASSFVSRSQFQNLAN